MIVSKTFRNKEIPRNKYNTCAKAFKTVKLIESL